MQRHLDAHVLVGVRATVEQDLRLILVGADVVRDLGRPELATEIALADGEALDDVRMRSRDRGDVRRHLGIRVVALVALRELVREDRGRRDQREHEQADGERGRRELRETAGCHEPMVPVPAQGAPPYVRVTDRPVRTSGPPASIDAMTDALAAALARIDDWGAGHAAAAVIWPGGSLARHGDTAHRFAWASVTKLVTAWTVHIATERGSVSLDAAAGPPGATVRHLLAHASGLPFEGESPVSAPGRRRIYSNPGYDLLGRLVAEASGRSFDDALREDVLDPLGMTSSVLVDRPSQGLHGSLDDLAAFAGELLRPTLVVAASAAMATSVAFPGLPGVVPGVGNFDPCDWGLGPELHAGKRPALDGRAQRRGRVRPLRRHGHLPLGRPRCRRGARGPDRPRVRTVGTRGVAGALGRGARRARLSARPARLGRDRSPQAGRSAASTKCGSSVDQPP